MGLHIIIDGYNLIRQSEELGPIDRRDIQDGREALLELLVTYRKFRKHRITVVFDAMNSPAFAQKRDRHRGIDVIYSASGETADTVIKRLAAVEREKALVVSSDREVQNTASARGCATIGSPEFGARLMMAGETEGSMGAGEDESGGGWVPTTRKKGPRRRLPKQKRRDRLKIRKL